MKRPGYYVNGVHYYGLDKRAQAIAKAKWLESEYGRKVDIKRIEHDFDSYIVKQSQWDAA